MMELKWFACRWRHKNQDSGRGWSINKWFILTTCMAYIQVHLCHVKTKQGHETRQSQIRNGTIHGYYIHSCPPPRVTGSREAKPEMHTQGDFMSLRLLCRASSEPFTSPCLLHLIGHYLQRQNPISSFAVLFFILIFCFFAFLLPSSLPYSWC